MRRSALLSVAPLVVVAGCVGAAAHGTPSQTDTSTPLPSADSTTTITRTDTPTRYFVTEDATRLVGVEQDVAESYERL